MKMTLITGVAGLICFFLVVMSCNSNFVPWFYAKMGIKYLSPEVDSYYRKKVRQHLKMEASIPDGSIIFIGDSMTQDLSVFSVTEKGVNFGIGGDTTVGVLKRIDRYEILRRAGAVVMAIGINDIPRRENEEIIENYKKIVGKLPKDVPIFFSSILPVDEKAAKRHQNNRINELNRALNVICGEYGNVTYIDTGAGLKDYPSGSLKSEFHKGDGLHLNETGYKQWVTALRGFLKDYN
jgi:lysophospholipase L1-like esterase